jgi:hypothetical protein
MIKPIHLVVSSAGICILLYVLFGIFSLLLKSPDLRTVAVGFLVMAIFICTLPWIGLGVAIVLEKFRKKNSDD